MLRVDVYSECFDSLFVFTKSLGTTRVDSFLYRLILESCGLKDVKLPEKHKENFDVSSEGPSSGS